MTKSKFLKMAARNTLAATALLSTSALVSAEETIKVGILHSLSRTMAISETTLKDVMLLLIEKQNEKSGLLGEKMEAVVGDPASQGLPVLPSARSTM